MICNKKKLFFFTIIIIQCFIVNAQSLLGKQIFVTATADAHVYIIFNSKIDNVNWNGPDPYPDYKFVRDESHDNAIILIATKNIGEKTLNVSEGKRNHRFTISYKNEITEQKELYYDFRNLTSLAKEVKALEQANKLKPNTPPPTKDVATTTTASTNSNTQTYNTTSTSAVESNKPGNNFYEYLRLINEALGKENFKDAMAAYDKANQANDKDESLLKAKLADIESKRNTKFNALMNKGRTADDNRKYDEAINYFNQASTIKDDDPLLKIALNKAQESKNAEEKRIADEKINQAYTKAMAVASNAYSKKDYDNAIVLYNEVFKIQGHEKDADATSWIRIINNDIVEKRKRDEKQKNDESYKDYVRLAEVEYGKDGFDNAILLYKKAMTVNGYENDKNASQRIAFINKKIEDNNKELAKKQVEAQYNNAIKTGDDAFNNNKYEQAKNAYGEALKTHNGIDAVATARIKKTNDKIAENERALILAKQKQDLADAYAADIVQADKAYASKDYGTAKNYYEKAAKLSDSNYPAAQLKKINEATEAENNKIAQLKKNAEEKKRYEDLITKADEALTKKDYVTSAAAYKQAIAINQNEQYPKDKLLEIKAAQDAINYDKQAKAEQAEAYRKQNEAFSIALTKARAAYKKNDLKNAVTNYLEAEKIKPDEKEPQDKIKEINDKLTEAAEQAASNNKYDSLKTKANIVLVSGMNNNDFVAKQANFLAAIALYEQADSIKPKETFPKGRIEFIKKEIAKSNALKAIDDSVALISENRKKYADANEKAKAELLNANNEKTVEAWQRALAAFREVLLLNKNDAYAQDRINAISIEIDKINVKSNNVAAASNNKKSTKNKPDPIVQAPVIKDSTSTAIIAVNKKEQNQTDNDASVATVFVQQMTPQMNAIPYQEEELLRKYPNIDFSQRPTDQVYNGVGNNPLNYSNSNILLAEKPRLNVSDSANGIKLTLEALSFKGTDVYLKFLVQNYNTNNFLVGPMMLYWNKKDGSKSKLLAGFISSFPILLPFSSFEIVYVTRNINVSSDESLVLEITERIRKSKVAVHIVGDIYKKEKER